MFAKGSNSNLIKDNRTLQYDHKLLISDFPHINIFIQREYFKIFDIIEQYLFRKIQIYNMHYPDIKYIKYLPQFIKQYILNIFITLFIKECWF